MSDPWNRNEGKFALSSSGLPGQRIAPAKGAEPEVTLPPKVARPLRRRSRG
jgi:hypothetical protein